MKKQKGRFTAFDASGRAYTVVIWVDHIRVGSFGGSSDEAVGIPDLRTDDGKRLIRLDKGRYKIVLTGTELTTKDPIAP